GPAVRVVARAGEALSFEARWPDGRREGPPVSRVEEQTAALALLERAITDEAAQSRTLAEQQAGGAPAPAQARAGLAGAAAPARPTAVEVPSPAPRASSRVVALWLWLVALFRSFFGRKTAPALPPVGPGEAARAAARRLTAARELRD